MIKDWNLNDIMVSSQVTIWAVKLNFIAKNRIFEYFIPALQYSMYILLTQYETYIWLDYIALENIHKDWEEQKKHLITSKTKKI